MRSARSLDKFAVFRDGKSAMVLTIITLSVPVSGRLTTSALLLGGLVAGCPGGVVWANGDGGLDAARSARSQIDRLDSLIRKADRLARREPDAALEMIEEAAKLLSLAPDRAADQRLALARASALLRAGRASEAEPVALRAVDLAAELGDARSSWDAARRLAEIYVVLNRTDEARSALDKSRTLADQLEEREPTIATNMLLSSFYARRGEHEKALDVLVDTRLLVDESREDGALRRPLEADFYNDLGNAYYFSEQPKRALEFYRRARELWKGQGRLEVVALQNVGSALFLLERYKDSFEVFRDARQLARSVGDDYSVSLLALNLSLALAELGRPVEALPQARAAHAAFEELGEKHELVPPNASATDRGQRDPKPRTSGVTGHAADLLQLQKDPGRRRCLDSARGVYRPELRGFVHSWVLSRMRRGRDRRAG